jgi:hypothetical protein
MTEKICVTSASPEANVVSLPYPAGITIVFNPAGIEAISGNPDIDMKLFYITARDKTRLLR